MDNRERYQVLLTLSGITQEQSAQLIEEQTMRPLKLRTVQSWLADPEKPSSRPCPDWAIIALQAKLLSMNLIELD